MKIGILLPYKENFSPEYPGAVSLFVNATTKISKYKKKLLFGNTDYKKKFKLRYINIDLKKKFLSSQTRNYVSKFLLIQKKYNFSIIEVHNRPSYINQLSKSLKKLFYHYIFIMILYLWMAQRP